MIQFDEHIFEMGWNHQLVMNVFFFGTKMAIIYITSLKLTAKAPENGWLEDYLPFGARPSFRGYVC